MSGEKGVGGRGGRELISMGTWTVSDGTVSVTAKISRYNLETSSYPLPHSLTQPLRAHKHLYPTHPLHRQVNCLARHRAWQSGTRRVPTPRGRFVLPSLAPCLSRSPTAVVAGCGGGGGDDDVGTAAAMLLRMLLTEIGAHRRRLVVGVAARDARRSPSFDWRWGSR